MSRTQREIRNIMETDNRSDGERKDNFEEMLRYLRLQTSSMEKQ